ncbi:MAG TPA: histidine phosphatase family protein [Caulobacteraceae bacterium]
MDLVYLIRHGRPAAVWGGDDDDPGLDETGAAQAGAAAKILLALPEGSRPRAVASSPLRRCRETAEPLAKTLGVPVEIVPEVGEVPTPAALTPLQRPGWLRAAFAGRWAEMEGDLDYEAWRRQVAQAVAARPGAAIFSHFVAINAVLSLIAGDDRVMGFRPDHTSISTLSIGPGGLSLVERGREAATGVL